MVVWGTSGCSGLLIIFNERREHFHRRQINYTKLYQHSLHVGFVGLDIGLDCILHYSIPETNFMHYDLYFLVRQGVLYYFGISELKYFQTISILYYCADKYLIRFVIFHFLLISQFSQTIVNIKDIKIIMANFTAPFKKQSFTLNLYEK